MKAFRSLMIAVPLTMLAMAVGVGEAAAKCTLSNVPASGPPPPAYLIDGIASDSIGFNNLNPADILRLELVCREVRDVLSGELLVEEVVVWVLTKTGYEQGVRHLLADLIAAQATFHAKEGRFAKGEELPRMLRGFFSEASQRLTLREGGWSASFDIILGGTSRASCHVVIGDLELPHPGIVSDIPACFVVEGAPTG